MIKVGIVRGTGYYTGGELLRLLMQYPAVELRVITSRSEAGQRLDHLFPSRVVIQIFVFLSLISMRYPIVMWCFMLHPMALP